MVALNGLKTVSESYVTLINCGPDKPKTGPPERRTMTLITHATTRTRRGEKALLFYGLIVSPWETPCVLLMGQFCY